MRAGSFNLIVSLLLLISSAACSSEEGRKEQMVNLQVITDNPEAQLTNLTAAIERSRHDGSLYARRAIVLLRKGELEEALTDADLAVKLSKNNPAALFVKAQVLYALGQPDEALPLALRAERNSYQSASLYVLLSELYLQRKDFRQARAYVNRALEISPADEYAFYYRGRIQAETSDTSRAIGSYKAALEQAPDFMEPQRELAGLYLARNDVASATPYVEAARKLAPDDALLWFYQGRLYQLRQKQDSAMVFFEQALALNDSLQVAHFQYGLGLYKRGDNEGAVLHLEQAAKEYRMHPPYITTLAGAYERLGLYRNALQQYQRLVTLDPRYSFAYQSISRLKFKLEGRRTSTDTATVEKLKILDFNIN
ncbi:tetratricopeptide repeat protein [Pontibacter qinzhouensis]|uniref:Tetratricopeptide repeat protein n=1 Tax=Pontibacter qinzhouensis TaxID=2603253 RepID=A0A5C8K889_9BACT|nr:tetratricopeptide repeat protein [Pontibacter qinzhouensis]TXK46374.1 tetratricopeptide repeat protein [Pontibacter qinzhouensis]